MRIRGLILTLLTLCPFAWADDHPFGFGPVELPNQFPLTVVHQSLAPTTGAVMSAGSFSANALASISNTFITEDAYLIDSESRELRLKMSYAPVDNLEVRLVLPVWWRGGGVMDGAIDNFHKFFNLPRGDREDVSEDQFFMGGTNRDGTSWHDAGHGTRLGNPELGLKYSLMQSDENAVSLLGSLSLPTASNSYGHENVDYLFGVAASHNFEDFIIHWGGSGIWYGDTEREGLRYTRGHGEAFGFIEYPVSTRAAFSAGLLGHSKVIRGLEGFPNYALYLDVGYHRRVSESTALSLMFRENPTPHDSTTDVTLVLGMQYFVPAVSASN